MNRELTNEEREIYSKQMVRLAEEIEDLDLQIRSQTLTVSEVLAYNYKKLRQREEAVLEEFKQEFNTKKAAFEDCAKKLKDGVEGKEDK